MKLRRLTLLLCGFALLWHSPVFSRTSGCGAPLMIATLDYPPFMDKTGGSGFALENVVSEALALKGCDSQVVHMPFARALQLAKIGKVDAMLSAWYRPDREAYLHYGPELFSAHNVLATLDSPHAPRSLADLDGLRLGIVRGYALPNAVDPDQFELVFTLDDRNSIAMLQKGRVDVVFVNAAHLDYLPRTFFTGQNLRLRAIAGSEQVEGFFFAMSRKRQNAAQINEFLRSGLRQLKWNGEHFAAHFLPDPVPQKRLTQASLSAATNAFQCAAKAAVLPAAPETPSAATAPAPSATQVCRLTRGTAPSTTAK